jgi:VWFA-related protein
VPLVIAGLALAQELDQSEVTTRETTPTFQARTNLVLVPVVVLDGQGRAVENLTREDFLLFDKGKPQTITKFEVQRAASQGPGAVAPERYVLYLFDDMHLTLIQMSESQKAGARHVAEFLDPLARAAVFTSTGQTILEFTGDRAQLSQAIASLKPRQSVDSDRRECLAMTYESAYGIANGRISPSVYLERQLECSGTKPLAGGLPGIAIIQAAIEQVRMQANRIVMEGEKEIGVSFEALRRSVRRMATMPGQRTIVFISPGFFTYHAHQRLNEITDAAVRANVTVHAIDPSGLNAMASNRDTLIAIAEGTGGLFYHNSNDLETGFRQTSTAPPFRYVLGFTPVDLKSDGTFHELKVKLRSAQGASLRARRGYFAPRPGGDPVAEAKHEIEDAVFSRDQIRDLPTEVYTQFFKTCPEKARLSVLTRIGVKDLPYRKVEGRNRDALTVISAVFDRNGNYVAGTEKAVEMRLRDETLADGQGPPVTVKSTFDLAPGQYVIRVVVREAEGKRLATENSVVDIPW